MKQNSQAGFGLIETMISMVILSVITMSTLAALEQMLMTSQTADVKNNVISLVASSTGIAVNQASCTAAVTKVSQPFGPSLQFNNLVSGALLPQYGLKVETMTYDAPALIAFSPTGERVYYGTLTVSFSSTRAIYGGPALAPRLIAAVYISVDSSNMITGCSPNMIDIPVTVVPTPAAPQVADITDECKRGCSDIGGEFSNGTCTIHSHD